MSLQFKDISPVYPAPAVVWKINLKSKGLAQSIILIHATPMVSKLMKTENQTLSGVFRANRKRPVA